MILTIVSCQRERQKQRKVVERVAALRLYVADERVATKAIGIPAGPDAVPEASEEELVEHIKLLNLVGEQVVVSVRDPQPAASQKMEAGHRRYR